MNKIIYNELVRLAKAGQTTNYSNIAPLVGLDMEKVADREKISEILGEISSQEFEHGRPMLSSVVVGKVSGKPGPGFFELAESLDLYDGKDDDEFYSQELEKVFAEWI